MDQDYANEAGRPQEYENQYVMNYAAPWEIYSIAFSCNKAHPYRLGIGSLKDEESNFVLAVNPDRSRPGQQ